MSLSSDASLLLAQHRKTFFHHLLSDLFRCWIRPFHRSHATIVYWRSAAFSVATCHGVRCMYDTFLALSFLLAWIKKNKTNTFLLFASLSLAVAAYNADSLFPFSVSLVFFLLTGGLSCLVALLVSAVCMYLFCHFFRVLPILCVFVSYLTLALSSPLPLSFLSHSYWITCFVSQTLDQVTSHHVCGHSEWVFGIGQCHEKRGRGGTPSVTSSLSLFLHSSSFA